MGKYLYEYLCNNPVMQCPIMLICRKLIHYAFFYRPYKGEDRKARNYNNNCNKNYTKDAVTPYHISKAVIEDASENASQEAAPLALLPNCRINAKRRGRRCFNMNSILFYFIFYFISCEIFENLLYCYFQCFI